MRKINLFTIVQFILFFSGAVALYFIVIDNDSVRLHDRQANTKQFFKGEDGNEQKKPSIKVRELELFTVIFPISRKSNKRRAPRKSWPPPPPLSLATSKARSFFGAGERCPRSRIRAFVRFNCATLCINKIPLLCFFARSPRRYLPTGVASRGKL